MADATRTIEIGSPGEALPTGAALTTKIRPTGLLVEFDGRTVTFNREWLRDNCPCDECRICLLYTSPSPRDRQKSRMPSSA